MAEPGLGPVPGMESPRPLEVGMQVVCPSRNFIGGTLTKKIHPRAQVTLVDGRKRWFLLELLEAGEAPEDGMGIGEDAGEVSEGRLEEEDLARCTTLLQSQEQLARTASARVVEEQKSVEELQKQFGGTGDQSDRAKLDQLMSKLTLSREQSAQDDKLLKADEEWLDLALAKVQRRNRLGIPGATPDVLAHFDADQLTREKTTKFKEEQAMYEQRQRQKTLDAAQAAPEPAPAAVEETGGGGAAPEPEAPVGAVITSYTCCKTAQIRSGFSLDSDKAGVLNRGSVIQAFEHRVNDAGTTRVRFSDGWVSMKTGTGVLVLEPVGESSGEGGSDSAAEAFVKQSVDKFLGSPVVWVKLVVPDCTESPLICRYNMRSPLNHEVQLILKDGSVSPYVKVYLLEEPSEDEWRAAAQLLRYQMRSQGGDVPIIPDADLPTPLAFSVPGVGWKKGLALKIFGESSYPALQPGQLPAAEAARMLGLAIEALDDASERLCAL